MTLGEIQRRRDGLWSITPFQAGLVVVSAQTASQTDAQCYLAALFSRVADVTVNGEWRRHGIVANGETLIEWSQVRVGYAHDQPTQDDTQLHEVVFWDANHGLKGDDRISIRVRSNPERWLNHMIKGVVAKVEGHVVYLLGDYSEDVDVPKPNKQSL